MPRIRRREPENFSQGGAATARELDTWAPRRKKVPLCLDSGTAHFIGKDTTWAVRPQTSHDTINLITC
jgi:hypothetical protein